MTLTRPARWVAPQIGRLRSWGPRIFAIVICATATAEALRLILTAPSDEGRSSGWYLLFVAAGLACGAFIKSDQPPAKPEEARALSNPAEDQNVVQTPQSTVAATPDTADEDTAVSSGAARRAVIFILAAIGYVIALPWLGFGVTNGLFLFVYFRWVSKLGWVKSISYAVLTDAVFVAGFALLSVRMPHGVLGLPF